MHMVWNINSNGDLYDNLYKDTQSHFTVLTFLKRKASLGLGFIWCVNKVGIGTNKRKTFPWFSLFSSKIETNCRQQILTKSHSFIISAGALV